VTLCEKGKINLENERFTENRPDQSEAERQGEAGGISTLFRIAQDATVNCDDQHGQAHPPLGLGRGERGNLAHESSD